jgi:capsular polysaccharide biosynthesis protein
LNMLKRISNKISRFTIFRFYNLGRSADRAAKTVRLEEGRPQLPASVERLSQYSEFLTISTRGVSTEIPRQHFFETRWIYKVKNVILDCKRGDIYLDEDTRIYESSNWHPFIPEYSRTSIPEHHLPQVSGESITYLAGWTYFHFLVENLPAFLAARQNLEGKKCLVAKDAPRYVIDAVTALGAEIVEVEQFTNVSEITFCGKGADTGWLHPSDLQILRSCFQEHFSEFIRGKAIYISRSNSSRSPLNESSLEGMMKDLGVEIVHPETLSFLEQIALFSEVEVVIGVHGAGLANQIWMNPKSTVFEILDINYFNICFEALATVCGHQYSSVIFDSKKTANYLPLKEIQSKCIEVLGLIPEGRIPD